MQTQTVKLTVNAENLVRNLRQAFTSSTSVLAELMQNARRAGGTSVAFEIDETTRTLCVEDNGRGLEDPQAMFCIGESGWDFQTMSEERPYGMGFMAAIYAAERVVIASCGKRIDIDTNDLLNFHDVDVETYTEGPVKGARITLHGWSWNISTTRQALAEYARGFPIEVLCNDESLPRPDALNGGKSFTLLDVGTGHIYDLERPLQSGKRDLGTTRTQVYLQGLPVSFGVGYLSDDHNVIHLDPNQFTGRMPDRSSLVNQAEAGRRIEEVIAMTWATRLRALKADLSAALFAALAYPTAKKWDCRDLFDDNDYLPAQVLSIADAYPRHRCDWEDGNSHYSASLVPRALIESARVKVVALADAELGEKEQHNWVAQMYAFLHGALIYDGGLPRSHWLHGLLTTIRHEDVKESLEDASDPEHFAGVVLWDVPVVVCNGYTLDGPLGPVRGRLPWYGRIVDRASAVIVFPRESREADVVRQVDDFWDADEEKVLEREAEEEEQRLLRFVRSRIPGKQGEVLHALLSDWDMRAFPGLCGSSFEVHIANPIGEKLPAITVRVIETRDVR